MNNPYHYIETIGHRQHHTPYHTYRERVPLEFDFHSYYAPTDGIVCFHSNQFGARWIRSEDQALAANNILVLGDSFTYGHGLHYEHTFIYRLQMKLNDKSNHVSFFNFSKRGANTINCLEIYHHFKDSIPHNVVLYGLHINDLVIFSTSYIATNPLAIPWLVKWSKGFDFVTKRIHKCIIKKYRIRRLRSSAIFESWYFIKNFKSLVELKKAANEKGIQLYVILLPILVDLKKDTFQPLYHGIKERLESAEIEYIDLTQCLSDYNDKDVWILPFDQHPNEKANEVFAEVLLHECERHRIMALPASGRSK
ncbi:SGNH/GDSL hydrolase family protein [candidate division KSB1 bacterium]|nr:SGNH/GDSL hydrolase family protein [candidate division KSB1 bacterium]